MNISKLAMEKESEIDSTADGYDAGRLNPSLGVGLADGFSFEGSLTELDDAIQLARLAVRTTADNDPSYAWRLHSLRIRLSARYSRTGDMACLEESIRLAKQVVDMTAKDDPTLARMLNGLANRIGDRYLRTGEMADLEQCIEVGRQAVAATPESHPRRAMHLNDLGAPLADRYKRTGAISDLEEAIRLFEHAVDMTPERDPIRAMYLSNLAVQLHSRYSKTQAISDLEEVIRLARQAVGATSNRFDRAGRLHNLGNGLGDRYARIGAVADLEEAVQIARQIVDIIPEENPNRVMYLNSLGARLSIRHSKMGEVADLEESIQLRRQAIAATPENHPDQAGLLSNLGNGLRARYLVTGQIEDLEQAIRMTRQALSATPDDHPRRAQVFRDLGTALFKRFRKTRATADFKEAMSSLRSALHSSNGSIATRIQAGHALFLGHGIAPDWQQAYDDSDMTIGLIPKLAVRSLKNSDKQHVLMLAVGVASIAAAVALQAEKAAFVALRFLEQGRGVLATSLEEMRTDILGLRDSYPELGDRFLRLREELEPLAMQEAAFLGDDRGVRGGRRYDAGNEFDKLIDEIRERPGFEEFLAAPARIDMQAAASSGPIVVINVSRHRCDAILVEEHRIRALALPLLKSAEIKKKVQRGNLGSPMVLEWLWDAVTNPILDVLGFSQPPPSTGNWPRVWWIPTGLLSKFPIHAAGRHGSGSAETVLDRVMSSYSPSIKAIIQGRRRPVAPSAQTQALLVAMKDTPDLSRLPHAGDEVAMLHDLCGTIGLNPIEPGQRRQDVLLHLPDCRIFHFAGHGHADSHDPSQSFLLLEDWKDDPLTVAALFETNLWKRPSFLAYLSACGTGQIKNERLVDESIHLINACQLTGFRHVIGTLWDVNDALCVDMARITYEQMRDGGMTDESVCQGLHKATRELRDRWILRTTNARRVSTIISKGSASQAGDRAESDADRREDRLSRNAVLFGYGDEEMGSLLWVPYVHFGV